MAYTVVKSWQYGVQHYWWQLKREDFTSWYCRLTISDRGALVL
jgi:hypothetical protein